MPQNEKVVEIIKERIQILERRREIDRRYGNFRAASEYAAIIRELRYILAEIERKSEGEGEIKQKKEEKQMVSSYHRSSSEVGRRNPK